ncbi:rasGEF domain-containing protein [Planoprotostelium fungivorum]|uniref:RasGEF domain-containing protein n=1 Tax=Planoprotostelium fungivorum TaxID=1890364 RepID=A0A2P6NMV1_9EUKA|nr:rasGEF domain-containing protein [Planoprotostelium fungivorum]
MSNDKPELRAPYRSESEPELERRGPASDSPQPQPPQKSRPTDAVPVGGSPSVPKKVGLIKRSMTWMTPMKHKTVFLDDVNTPEGSPSDCFIEPPKDWLIVEKLIPVPKKKEAEGKGYEVILQLKISSVLLISQSGKGGTPGETTDIFRNHQQLLQLHKELDTIDDLPHSNIPWPSKYERSFNLPQLNAVLEPIKRKLQEYLNMIPSVKGAAVSEGFNRFIDPEFEPLMYVMKDKRGKQGNLKHNSGVLGKWVDHWVVIYNEEIHCYKSADSANSPLFCVPLNWSTLEVSTKDTFTIKTYDGREFAFRCKNEEDRVEWVSAIRRVKSAKSTLKAGGVSEITPEISDVLVQSLYFTQSLREDAEGVDKGTQGLFASPKRTESDPTMEDFDSFRLSGMGWLTGSGIMTSNAKFPEMLGKARSNSRVQMGQNGRIKSAPIETLIEKVNEEEQEIDFVLCFLLTYRAFTTPDVVLRSCLSRFRSLERLEPEKSHPRICTVLARWIEVNVGDFNDELSEELIQFVENDLESSPKNHHLAKKIRDQIRKRVNIYSKSITKRSNSTSAPKMELPYAFNGYFDLLDIPAVEIARQMTIIEYNMFRMIRPQECLSIKEKEKYSPNLTHVTQRFNRISLWVQTEILRPCDVKIGGLVISRFIEIAKCCFDLNNYNTTFQILSGLNSTPIYRLKRTWAEVSPQWTQIYQDMHAILSPDKSYKSYRDRLHTLQPPCVPYLGVYLTDLVMVEEGNTTWMEAGIVNFEKCNMFYRIIREIMMYQQTGYNLESEPSLREYLMSVNGHDEEKLYEESVALEPRR